MIGRLRGVVAEVEAEDCVIDVMGVGYVLRCGSRTLNRLAPSGEEVVLHVELTWSAEQGPRLLGFLTRDERAAFRLLTAIQGVGPKAALALLDVLTPQELAAAVARDDRASIGRANGVGPKLAQRIATELKGKPIAGGPLATLPQGGQPTSPADTVVRDAVAALIGLGIADSISSRTVDDVLSRSSERPDLATLIRLSLRELGR
jgi:Holliday junction DNA helicase RuvA